MAGLQKRMHEIEDRIFAAFSEKVGPACRTLLSQSMTQTCAA